MLFIKQLWYVGAQVSFLHLPSMATHSSILAWRIPWTEEPGGLQFMGSQRVGHDWATSPTFTPHNSILRCDYRWRDFGSGSLNNLTMQGQIPSELQLPDLGGWQKVKESEDQHVGFAISTVSRGTHWDLLGCSLKLQFLRPQLKSMKLESPRDGNTGSSF